MSQVRQRAEETPVFDVQQPKARRILRSFRFQRQFVRLHAALMRLPLASRTLPDGPLLGLKVALQNST